MDVSSASSATIADAPDVDTPKPSFEKGSRFWLIFLALCASSFLSALDLTAVSTILPTMAADLHSSEYSWIGTAYALTSCALIPWTGGLSAIFGRKAAMLGSLVFFAVGSAVTGAAPSMSVAILGRSLQGIGGGGILTMSDIVITDLIPLAERGAFYGILGSVWAIASAIGPPIGGAFASGNQWRWLFYMNIPIAGFAILFVALFLNVKSPQTTFKEKLSQMDYVNVIFVAASTSAILGLTFGGSSYPWSSYKVLVPLVLGIFGLVLFLWIEKNFVEHPTVPFDILRHRTSMIGFFTTFIHGLVSIAAIYYLPVYFQSTKGTTAIQSGIDLFSLSFTIAPFAIFTGISVTILSHYKLQNIAGWAMIVLGFGLTTLLEASSSKAAWVAWPVIMGIGFGILYAGTNYPVLAPLKPEQQPAAMAFFGFTRAFGQVFGIAIGSTVLQNELVKTLPEAFYANFGSSSGIAFAAIPFIKTLSEPLKTQVRVAFADSLRRVWQVSIGIAGMGFLASLFMENLALSKETNAEWGLEERRREGGGDLEGQREDEKGEGA